MIDLLGFFIGHKWQLKTLPKPDKGTFSGVYNCGTMLAYDYLRTPTGEESYMQVIRHASPKAFDAYINKIDSLGFKRLSLSSIDGNTFADYEKDGNLHHIYYTASTKEIRVIEDAVSISPDAFSYTTEKSAPVEVYQYALLYDDNFYRDGGAIEQCGMNYVIKLADGKLFIIDGGMFCQSSDSAIAGFWDFLKEITGTQNEGKVDIACWFCTHAHNDHMQFFYKFLTQYEGHYNVERFMFNFPSNLEVHKADRETYVLKMRLKKYCSNAVYVKPHTGQHYTFGGMDVDVMYTHEDCYNASFSCFGGFRFNDSSTVLKLSYQGKVFYVLGDIDLTAARVITKMYSEKTLHADIVQIAHHGFNYNVGLYNKMKGKIYLFPQSEKNARNINFGCKRLLAYLDANFKGCPILFARDNTYGITFDKDGNAQISARPYVGEDKYYDGSPI